MSKTNFASGAKVLRDVNVPRSNVGATNPDPGIILAMHLEIILDGITVGLIERLDPHPLKVVRVKTIVRERIGNERDVERPTPKQVKQPKGAKRAGIPVMCRSDEINYQDVFRSGS